MLKCSSHFSFINICIIVVLLAEVIEVQKLYQLFESISSWAPLIYINDSYEGKQERSAMKNLHINIVMYSTLDRLVIKPSLKEI